MQKKKIGLIMFWYPIGVSPALINLAEFLAKANFQVHIFIDDNTFQQTKVNFSDKNIILHLIRKIPPQQLKFKNSFDLIRHRIEVLVGFYRYCHQISTLMDRNFTCFIGADTLGMIAANWVGSSKKIPVVYYNLELLLTEECRTIKDKIVKFFEKRASQKARWIIIQDQKRAEYLIEDNNLAKEKFIFIPTAMSNKTVSRNDFLRKKFRISHDKKIILYAGEMVPWSMGLEIAQAAQKWGDDLVLVLHSSRIHEEVKDYLHKIKSIIIKPGKVYFSEPVKWGFLPKIIASADIGLAFYGDNREKIGHYEIGESSGKLASYLQVGLPVITCDSSSFKNIINKYQIGEYAHHVNQIENLAKKILKNYNFYHRNSRKCFKVKYDYANYFPRILQKIRGG